MLVDTGIKLTEDEITEAVLLINVHKSAMAAVQSGISKNYPNEIVRPYLEGIADAYIKTSMDLDAWRKKLSEKYNIPYDFLFDTDKILIENEEI